MSQAQYHVARAKAIDEQEREQRKKQQLEREQFRIKQLEIQKKLEDEKRVQMEEKYKLRETYKEKMKDVTKLEVILIQQTIGQFYWVTMGSFMQIIFILMLSPRLMNTVIGSFRKRLNKFMKKKQSVLILPIFTFLLFT